MCMCARRSPPTAATDSQGESRRERGRKPGREMARCKYVYVGTSPVFPDRDVPPQQQQQLEAAQQTQQQQGEAGCRRYHSLVLLRVRAYASVYVCVIPLFYMREGA
eukprot:GHVU01203197.1.p1 GENE.GHVU01203197.1~~GHVU01203197.1.p1  ORF type:complete len:106 (-),score=13.50 GHVU01203197.1:60-377(-)